MWNKIRKVLGALTDLLLIGRQREWWREEHKMENQKKGLNK